MTLKRYTLSVASPEDWTNIHGALIVDSNEDGIPDRKITCTDEKTVSPTRGTYELTEEEAEEIGKHHRVKWIELSLKDNPESFPKPQPVANRWSTAPKVYRDLSSPNGPPATNPTSAELNRTNWAVHRVGVKTVGDVWGGSVNDVAPIYRNVNYNYDGKDVDIVIQDSGVLQSHPEFLDENGVSRVKDIVLDGPYYIDPDWFTSNNFTYTKADGSTGIATDKAITWWENVNERTGSFAGVPQIIIPSLYTADRAVGVGSTGHSAITNGHGTACAGLAAGKNFGLAFKASIWNMPCIADAVGMDIETSYDLIKLFHQYKPSNPTLGVKSPTVVNGSWGYQAAIAVNSTSIVYRFAGASGYISMPLTTPADPADINDLLAGLNNQVLGAYRSWTTSSRSNATDEAGKEMMDAGVIFVTAAGNNNQRIGYGFTDAHRIDCVQDKWFGSNDSRPDFNNISTPVGSRDFMNPSGVGFNTVTGYHPVINVGAIDDYIDSSGKERKVDYSNNGPGVDVYAPADETLSAGMHNISANRDYQRYDDDKFFDCYFNGTSAAAPVVCGLMGLYAQRFPTATPTDAKNWVTGVGGGGSTPQSYSIDVTNSGSGAYTLSGTDRNGSVSGNNVTVTANVGDTLNFAVNASGHPFWVKTAAGTGTGNQATGVTNGGTESGTVTWTPSAAGTYYYQCEYHGGMVGTITVSAPVGGGTDVGSIQTLNNLFLDQENDIIKADFWYGSYNTRTADGSGTIRIAYINADAGVDQGFTQQVSSVIGRVASKKTTYTDGTITNTLLYTATSLVTLNISASNQTEERLTHSVSISANDDNTEDDYIAYGIPMEVGGNEMYDDVTLKAGDQIYVSSSKPGVSFVAIASRSFPNTKLDIAKSLGRQNAYISSTAFPQINDNVGLATAAYDGVATIHISNRNSDRTAAVSVGIASGDISTFQHSDFFLFGLRLKPLQDLKIDNIGIASGQTLVTRASRTDVAFAAYTEPVANVDSGIGTDGSVNTTGVVTATAFVGDGSRITGVIAQGIGVSISDENAAIGVAATINFGKYLDVSPISAGIVTVSVPNLVGTAQTALTLDASYAVGLASNAYTADYATNAGVATNADNADACSGNAATATMASGIVTTFEIKSMFPITTTDKFYGDGSQLTNIVATGSGIGIRNDNTLVGTAQTVNFGLSLDTIISSSGIATVTVQKVPHADICGVASYSDKCGVATFADNAGIASNALNANFAQTASFSTLTGAAETSKSLYTEFQGNFKPLPVTIGGKTINHRYNGIGSDKSINIQGYNSPYLRFEVGQTYRFENAAQQANYPLEFYYAASGEGVGFGTTSPSKMTQGVTVTGSYTEIVVTPETPQLFYYGAGVGSTMGSMGNSIQVFNHEFHKYLRVGEYKNLAGLKTCTHTQMFEGRATAWYMNTNLGVGNSDYVPGDRSHNVSSIEQQSTGVYTVNFADAMKDNNYAVVIDGRGTNNFPGGLVNPTVYDRTTTGFGVTIYNGIPAVEDLRDVNIVVYGGQDGEATYL